MTLDVLAPLPGEPIALARVPDPVFAAELVGAGVAVEPHRGQGSVTVVAPVAGAVVKLHPHAFVVQADDGTLVLVHIGIDTVRLGGKGFSTHVAEGDCVTAGQPVTTFDPDAVRAEGMSAVCPVVVLGSAPGSVPPPAEAHPVDTQVLFTWGTGE